jgi:epoxyqueuosine reductase
MWNVMFSQTLTEDSPFKARPVPDGKGALTLATDILTLNQEQVNAAFRESLMKRAKLVGLERNAAVVLVKEADR